MLKSILMLLVPGFGAGYRFRLFLHLREFYRRHNFKWLGTCLKNKLLKNYGCELSINAFISPKVQFMHTTGVVIGDGVEIGDGTKIYSNVCLGRKNIEVEDDYPKIGKNCVLSTGVKILGKIVIADDTVIGANSVILRDILDSGCTYVGIPGRRVK